MQQFLSFQESTSTPFSIILPSKCTKLSLLLGLQIVEGCGSGWPKELEDKLNELKESLKGKESGKPGLIAPTFTGNHID